MATPMNWEPSEAMRRDMRMKSLERQLRSVRAKSRSNPKSRLRQDLYAMRRELAEIAATQRRQLEQLEAVGRRQQDVATAAAKTAAAKTAAAKTAAAKTAAAKTAAAPPPPPPPPPSSKPPPAPRGGPAKGPPGRAALATMSEAQKMELSARLMAEARAKAEERAARLKGFDWAAQNAKYRTKR